MDETVCVSLPGVLREVVHDLEADPHPTSVTLAAALRRPIGIDDVAQWIHFDAQNYVRSLVARGDRWELRLLCWRPGQTSSLHGHTGAACAFRVLRGSAVEIVLGCRDRVLPPGSVVEEPASGVVHQVGNAGGDAMLTLHAYSPPLPVEAPSPREGRNVVVVGGGMSGVAVAIHLLARGDRALRIYLVERGPWIGRGIAYGVDGAAFRLNVPASKMSLDPRRPDDFMAWAGAGPDDFLPRAKFGEYVVTRFAEALRTSPAKLRLVRGEAVAVDEGSVRLSDGIELPAETVVLASGIEPRVAPSSLPADSRILDAWDECALAALPRTGRVLLLGAGLSALDVVALLHTRGFEGSVTILSRRGLLPRPHLSPLREAVPLAAELVDAAPPHLRGLLRWGRATVRAHEARGLPWQLAIDALRPHVTRLYGALPPAHRARFVRSVRPYWDVLRHRAPLDALARVDSLRQEGRLEILAGRIARCEVRPDSLEVELVPVNGPARRERYDRIVRCIGPALDRSEAEAPLDRALIASGLAAADAAGLGIVTDEVGRVVGASGAPSERLLAIGAVRRASSWETTAVPAISAHALALAKRIVP
jgi:uncharacterized NAD(P)/FAD-binding protein YdhS/quercetin dioxygenase-like cupin family protein